MYNINIDMDKRCRRCESKGVAGETGLCLNCASENALQAITDGKALNMDEKNLAGKVTPEQLKDLAMASRAYQTALLEYLDAAATAKEHKEHMREAQDSLNRVVDGICKPLPLFEGEES